MKDETSRQADEPAPGPVTKDLEPELDLAAFSFTPRPEPWRLSHLMYLVAAAAILCWVGVKVVDSILLGSFLLLVSVVLLFVAAMGGGVILARRRSTRQDALLWVLAIATERSMALAPAIVAFADQYRGAAYRRLMNLAAQLNGGTVLPDALERARKIASRDAVLLAWVGHETGTLPKALRMAATSRWTHLPIWTAIAARFSYVLALLLAMQTISGFILYFIIPKFEAIFKDFGLPLPQVTIMTIEASHFVMRYSPLALVIPPVEIVLLIFLPLSFLGWGNYSVPIFDRLMSRRHTALVLRALALTVEGGKPIALGLKALANHYPTPWVRRRLVAANSDIEHGADWIESLWNRGLIRAADAEVLSSAAAVGNLAWALYELAETIERRLATRFQGVVQTLFPLTIMLLGMVVFILAVAYFLPLVQLITQLANS
jgi:protein transport protein HofC